MSSITGSSSSIGSSISNSSNMSSSHGKKLVKSSKNSRKQYFGNKTLTTLTQNSQMCWRPFPLTAIRLN